MMEIDFSQNEITAVYDSIKLALRRQKRLGAASDEDQAGTHLLVVTENIVAADLRGAVITIEFTPEEIAAAFDSIQASLEDMLKNGLTAEERYSNSASHLLAVVDRLNDKGVLQVNQKKKIDQWVKETDIF